MKTKEKLDKVKREIEKQIDDDMWESKNHNNTSQTRNYFEGRADGAKMVLDQYYSALAKVLNK